jgi:hypothetical protein
VRITDAFEVREVPNQREGRVCVKLLTPLEYHVGSENSQEVITVPAGFVTDFASVPWGLWNLFPPLGRWARAAIVHDFLYETRGLFGRYSRSRCDDIFREAMAVVGVGKVQRNLMWAAVRVGGPRF